MKIGFIGTGGIAEAIVIGLMEHGHTGDILVSRRTVDRSSRLAATYSNVQIIPKNQVLVDRCELVFIAVLPEQARPLIRELTFRSDQRVVSLVAGLELPELRVLVQPAHLVFRIIPLPPIEYGVGPVVICPPENELERFLGTVGTTIATDDESQFTSFSAASSVMASFFELEANLADWIHRHGVPRSQAARYATSLFAGLANMSTRMTAEQLQDLSQECLTPGGLNEQVLNECQELNWFDLMIQRWDRIHERLQQMGNQDTN